MINFIMCDDCMSDLKKTSNIIDKFMMKNKIHYEKHMFSDYDDNFVKMISANMMGKIYVLDIETPTRSGIDIARMIRNKDSKSIIIFLTGYDDFGNVLLKNDFSFLSFINKFEDIENRLNNSLKEALKHLNEKDIISINDNGRILKLSLFDILYITKDSVKRKTIIKTDCSEFKTNVSLTQLKDELNEDFIQTHRCCIINKERVVEYNKRAKTIVFDNGEKIDLISRDFKGEII